MKIGINDIRFVPKTHHKVFNLCVYGELKSPVKEWVQHWKLQHSYDQPYTNILLPNTANVEEMFDEPKVYAYVDGFSPNLNKHLHVGHLSNLVLAKAFQGLGIGNNFLAILGDTLTSGTVSRPVALAAFNNLCHQFKYRVDDIFFASQVRLDESKLIDGEGDFANTKVFDIEGEKIVGVKSDGSTTYFYQDVALAQILDDSTLYLTGLEQDNHFRLLAKLYPKINHIGLGLIKFNGKKMSSSEGNVIYITDLLNQLLEQFNGDYNVAYNILAGNILKSEPKVEKNIDSTQWDNVKLSLGLYISYTMARMNSAGIELMQVRDYPYTDYNDVTLRLKSLKSKITLKPHILFEGLVDQCGIINALYRSYKIQGNNENRLLFQKHTHDLMLGVHELGLLPVHKL